MSAEFLPREAFADEQSYIAHRRHVAALQRAEKQRASETAWQRAQREDYRRRKREGRLTPAERKFERMKRSEQRKRLYWRDPERGRELSRRWYWKNPVHARESGKPADMRYRMKHREELRLYAAVYYMDHREEVIARMRNKRAEKPGYVSQEELTKRAREFERQVAALRNEGWTWAEIGELVDRNGATCFNAYKRWKKRQEQQDTREQSA